MNYSVIAPGYDELYREEQLKKLNILKKHLKIKKDFKLLDIGCGTGISTNFFDCECHGIDPCKEMIAKSNGNIKQAEAENIPYPDNYFDIIISITAIHHFNDLDKVIEEIKRVAKPKAQIAITILKKARSLRKIKEVLIKEFNLQEYDEEKDLILIGNV